MRRQVLIPLPGGTGSIDVVAGRCPGLYGSVAFQAGVHPLRSARWFSRARATCSGTGCSGSGVAAPQERQRLVHHRVADSKAVDDLLGRRHHPGRDDGQRPHTPEYAQALRRSGSLSSPCAARSPGHSRVGASPSTRAVYPLTHRPMISTGAPPRPGRTRAGTPHPARNRRCATASGGPGHVAAPAEPGLVSGEGVAWQRGHRTLRPSPEWRQ